MTSASTPPQAPWRPLRAVTLDLWGTLIDSRDPIGKIERRREMLLTAIRSAGHPIELEQLRAGFRAARRVIDDGIARDRRDVGPPGGVVSRRATEQHDRTAVGLHAPLICRRDR